nr:MAG: nonstructural protein [Microviridae sp.]
MKVSIYVIKDLIADETGPVFSAKNDEVAKRQMSIMLIDNSIIHSDDYELWKIADYDNETMDLSVNRLKIDYTVLYRDMSQEEKR